MEYEGELYAERIRRKAQAAALASGAAKWTEELSRDVRIKLRFVWQDLTMHRAFYDDYDQLVTFIHRKTHESIAYPLEPDAMTPTARSATNDQLLSLIEVEHEALTELANAPVGSPYSVSAERYWHQQIQDAPEEFRRRVNQIFEAHIVAFHLHQNSQLVPIDSHEMHNAVVEPTLYLLHSQPHFQGAEAAYQKALKELRVHDAGDAITDAAAALQEVLTALGCAGNTIGDLLKAAKNNGLLKGNDTPLTDAIGKTIDWVAAKRNQGEAHRGDPDINMSDAWMVVHVVGALVIRLSEAAGISVEP